MAAPQVVYNVGWVVGEGLMALTGLPKRQLKAYRQERWIEGVHFKRVPAKENAEIERATIWYFYPLIDQFIQDA
ncbi:excisionase family protein [Enterobacter hormaechei]|uniref:excisionase family protein n=1 Tax=Enterobacter hormaechei TaxID=158836 RepID=UPI002A7529CC|nr:excisionase family protein [Enterobacter hormaechei]MDY3570230.1 excisionase family protein [Enterobacter hormaechei]